MLYLFAEKYKNKKTAIYDFQNNKADFLNKAILKIFHIRFIVLKKLRALFLFFCFIESTLIRNRT